MAVRKPIVILNDNHLSELQAGDGLMSYLDPGTTTLSQLIQAMLDAGVIAAEVPSLPVNISAPVVTGASFVGDTATTTNGVWSGGTIIEYEYLWQENDGSWENVLGETSNTFANIPLGQFRSAVRARNAVGWSDWEYSVPFVVSEAPTGISYVQAAGQALQGSSANEGTTAQLTGVTAGNSLILVIYANSDPTSADLLTSLSAPAGSSWEVVSRRRMVRDGWAPPDYPHEVIILRALGVSAGTHVFNMTFPISTTYTTALIEVTGTPVLDAVGYEVRENYVYDPYALNVSTSTAATAGDRFVIGGAFITNDYGSAGNITNATGFTTIGALRTADYHTTLIQRRDLTLASAQTVSWNADKTTTGNRGGISFVAVFK